MDRRPPIILDDPFVTFDDERAQRALELLKEVAAEQGFQVLLLTCSDRFDALADELVVLEAPTAMAADAPADAGRRATRPGTGRRAATRARPTPDADGDPARPRERRRRPLPAGPARTARGARG